jgi:hypothetical protein
MPLGELQKNLHLREGVPLICISGGDPKAFFAFLRRSEGPEWHEASFRCIAPAVTLLDQEMG